MASSEHYIWAVEGKPVSVHLGADVVRTLEDCLPSRSASRDNETGGFLLGRVRQVNDSWIVAVDSIQFAACEHARGPSWTLSRVDTEAFARQKARLSSRGVVGWFRTHTRPGLYLDQHDFSIFREFFPHPASIALVVRPDAEAGFFFWEKSDIERSRSCATFTCRAEALKFSARNGHDFGLPAVPPRPGLRKELLWIPAAAGIAIALLWSPRVPFSRQAEPSSDTAGAERPVFAPRPEPEEEGRTPLYSASAAAPAKASRPPKPSPMPLPRVEEPATPTPAKTQTPRPPAVPAAPQAQPDERPAKKQAPARVVATLDPPAPNIVKRAVGSIPGLGFLKKRATDKLDAPPAVVRQVRPSRFDDAQPVRVKVKIDKDGYVRSAHLLTSSASAPTAQSVIRAAREWRFTPARQANRPVESEMVLTFQPAGGGTSISLCAEARAISYAVNPPAERSAR